MTPDLLDLFVELALQDLTNDTPDTDDTEEDSDAQACCDLYPVLN